MYTSIGNRPGGAARTRLADVVGATPTHLQRRACGALYRAACRRPTRLGAALACAGTPSAMPAERIAPTPARPAPRPGVLLAQLWFGLVFAAAQCVSAQSISDLSLAKTVSDPTPLIGTRVTFAITVANSGPNPVQRIVVRDRLPNGNATEDDYAQATTTPQAANVPPVITGQRPLGTPQGAPLAITLADLTVSDPDDVYPEDFTLGVRAGANYALTGATEVTPDPGFSGTLTVPVTVNDGAADSAPFDLLVTVTAAATGPNIVVLMLDDLDARSLDDLLNAGLMPNLQTHVIGRGVGFSEAYASTPLCCPSRATFLTGQYPHNTGIVTNKLLDPVSNTLQWAISQFDDSVTLATRLTALGYTTAHVGKYLNGYGSDPTLSSLSPAFDPHYVPPGWSHWRALVDFATYCVYDFTISADGVLTPYLRPPGQTEDSASYQTNVLADLAESFVLAHRDDAAPFYLEVMPLAPHAEHCADAYGGQPPAPDSFESRIRPAPEDAAVAVPAFVPGAAFDEDIADKPDWLAGWPALTASDRVNIAAQYQHRLRSLLSVDRMLGRIVAALGPAIDDTVLLFTSDNGWLYGEHRASSKIYAYRESARVPLYVALPGASAPQARANLVLNNDLAPTLLEIAAPGYGDAPFDGRSLAPILLDPAPPGWQDRSRFLIEYARSRPDPDVHPSYAALRSWNLLYIESYAGAYYSRPPRELIGLELYDLVSDPHEMNSIVHFPENPRDSVLGSWLDLLSTCAGESCRQYENAQSPP